MAMEVDVMVKIFVYLMLIFIVGWIITKFIGPKLFGFLDFSEKLDLELILPIFRNIYILKNRG